MVKLKTENYSQILFILSIIILGSALTIEYVFKYRPCNLCLIERIPYGLTIIILIINYIFKKNQIFYGVLLMLLFAFSFIISVYHLGIEQGFVEESLVCDLKNGSNLLSKEDILRQLQEKNISCKDVTFKILGLSLTSYNIIISILIVYFTTRTYLSYDNNK